MHALDMVTMAPDLTHCLQAEGAMLIELSGQYHEQQQYAARDELGIRSLIRIPS